MDELVSNLLDAYYGGDPRAAMTLGDLYAKGIDGEPDHKKAAEWYGEAARSGLPGARDRARLEMRRSKGKR